mmetsp:Transcript_25168/g.41783  ORF Transcript_25168/g.41783 Transcript_25168/m.41783 type:complete len:104 (+) Transcript_25168:768-1079(+)
MYMHNTEVCGISHDRLNFTTFDTPKEAHEDGSVVHCGSCGDCSNFNDMEIYARTRDTLTGSSTKCAFLMLMGRKFVSDCLQRDVGFTAPCSDCWQDNIQCTVR